MPSSIWPSISSTIRPPKSRTKHLQRGSFVEAPFRLVEPLARLLDLTEDGDSLIKHSYQPRQLVGFVGRGPAFATSDA